VIASLNAQKLSLNPNGLLQLLEQWAQVIQPEHVTLSTPHDWHYPALHQPPNPAAPWTESHMRPDLTTLFDEVVLPLAHKLSIPILLRMGTRRLVNSKLGVAGDGMGSADVESLQHLCARHPAQKFMATFLSRENHHEVTVLGTKFRNLHVVGCWWYCNSPSSVRLISELRLELLGTGFTAIASSARVLDQLIYKWAHSRHSLAEVLHDRYRSLGRAGWPVSRQQIRRDVAALCGGAYLDFIARPL